jgi:hypothetical protein
MKNEHTFRYWLIANLVLLSASLLMPWFFGGWEPGYGTPIAGWSYIFTRIINAVLLFLQSGFAWRRLLDFIQGVAGIFVMVYVVFKTVNIAKPRGYKSVSIILLIVVVIFLSCDFALFNLRLPGYGLFILGLLTSVVFEWQRSMLIDATARL